MNAFHAWVPKSALEANDPLQWISLNRQAIYLAHRKTANAPITSQLADKASETERLLSTLPTITKSREDRLLRLEAEASSAIENETSKEQVEACLDAIKLIIHQPPTRRSLLKAHSALMAGRNQAQPGQYRTVNVRVGYYNAPPPEYVSRLMSQRLFGYIRDTDDNPALAATWAHIVFETIHPFADGNGRTGRALILRMLGRPLPVSIAILEQRNSYYRLLSQSRWENFASWMLDCINDTCRQVIGDKV